MAKPPISKNKSLPVVRPGLVRLTRLLNSLTSLQYALLPGHCLLCRCATQRKLDLCAVCESDLPRLESHCGICCEPLFNSSDELLAKAPSPAKQSAQVRQLSCGKCLSQPPAFSQMLIPYLYRSPIDRLVWQFKFKGDLIAGEVLGQLLAQHITQYFDLKLSPRPDLIIPVPLHWRRRLNRGYNQAGELATALGRSMNIPVNHRLIKRTVNTPRQLNFNRRQRQAHMRNSFAISNKSSNTEIVGLTFAIVDDVVTTTATVEALAKLLIKNGAAQVIVWASARTVLEN